MNTDCEHNFCASEFLSLLSNTLTNPGLEQLFSVAFVLTVETGFVPTSLTEHFDSINSNIKLAKMISCLPLNSFWHRNNNIFTAQLVMSNQLCYLTGVPSGGSLVITLSYSNTSKCSIFDHSIFNENGVHFPNLSIKFKNSVSVPIKCSILDITIGRYPNLCGIPEELLLSIMSKLDSADLYALMRCCKKLNNLAISNNYLWEQLCSKLLKNRSSQGELDISTNQNQITVDWRRDYYRLKRQFSGRKTIPIIRE